MKTSPWHSKLPTDHAVHHDDTRCIEGRSIASRNVVSGAGGRPKCPRCREISDYPDSRSARSTSALA
jgi:hypothetical protein